MKIYLINGYPRAGKDTFVKFCQEQCVGSSIMNISTVDLVKEAATILGWNGEKTPEMRHFLSDLKDLADSYLNASYKYINLSIIEAKILGNVSAIFVHIREPQQLAKFKKEFNAKCILVERESSEKISNHADEEVNNFSGYDYYINNYGSLEDLKKLAKNFLISEGLLE